MTTLSDSAQTQIVNCLTIGNKKYMIKVTQNLTYSIIIVIDDTVAQFSKTIVVTLSKVFDFQMLSLTMG